MELRWYQQECVDAMSVAEEHSVAVLPTGAGKTLVIAEFIKHFQGDVLVLSHSKEILGQNYAQLVRYLDEPVGLYSASWSSKTQARVTVAGVQSVRKKAFYFTHYDLVLVDECHLVNTAEIGVYRAFIKAIGAKCIGLTATPYRLGQGYLWNGEEALFKGLCYDLSHDIPRLQEEGFLCTLKTKAPPGMVMDTRGIAKSGGDFKLTELSQRFVDYQQTFAAMEEVVKHVGYKKVLIFCINIKHAEITAEILESMGVHAGCVHSKIPLQKRADILEDSSYQMLVNVGVLTTGYDAPDIDMIVLLRPTASTSLFCQMVGRGLRVSPGKDHCLVLDFAGNIERIGPITDPKIDKKGKPAPDAEAPEKCCPACGCYVPLGATVCSECQTPFPEREVDSKVESAAYEGEVVEKKGGIVWKTVQHVTYTRHSKIGKPDSVKIAYHIGGKVYNEWLCIEHPGAAGRHARYRLLSRWQTDTPPRSIQAFLQSSDMFEHPTRIMVDTRDKYPKVIDRDYRKIETPA